MGRAVALSPLRTQIRRSMRPARLFLFAAWLCAGPAAAQDATPYVPLQHWAMPYVEHLIATGVIADPTPLTRPLREADVVRALEATDTASLPAPVRGSVRRLLAAFASTRQGPRYHVVAELGLGAATYMKRDPLAAVDTAGPRQAGPEHGTVHGGLALDLRFG